MSMRAPDSDSGLLELAKRNPEVSIGVLVVGTLLVAGWLMSRNQQPSPAASNPNGLSGLQTDANGNRIVYVPTQTIFENNSTNSGNTTTNTTNNPPAPTTPAPPTQQPPVVRNPPVPAPKPQGGLYWDQRYSVKRGDTLSGIAWGVTNWLRVNKKLPSTITITANDLYSHNKNLIDSWAAQRGYPVSRNPMDNIFEGQTLVTPRWQA